MAEILYNNKLIVSPSKMTFKEYYTKFIGINDPNLANGWGWFIDIELNSEPVREIQHRTNKYNNYELFPFLSTKKNISIHSKKSVRNLHDTPMIFEIYEHDKQRSKNINPNSTISNYSILFTNCICVFALIIFYYISYS